MGKRENDEGVNNLIEFTVKFKDGVSRDFLLTFFEEKRFYKKNLNFKKIAENKYVVTANPEAERAETARAWYILHEKYKALSAWGKHAPVQFLSLYD